MVECGTRESVAVPLLAGPEGVTVPPVKEQPRLAHKLSVDRYAIYKLLKELALDNEEYFTTCPTWSSYGARMVECCADLQSCLPKLRDLVAQLQDAAPGYDYDERIAGNGYRSIVCICDTVLLHLVSLLKLCMEQRATMMFRLTHYCKELEAFNLCVHFLLDALPQTLQARSVMPGTSLFPPLEGNYEKYHEILKGIEKLDSKCFFGRPLGFQFSPSVSRVFRVIGIVLATYSLSWEKGHGALGSLLNSGRFFLSPEQRASRILKVTKEADISFCKGFWNLSELGNNMPKWFCPNMVVNELREIPHTGDIVLETKQGGTVNIPEPSAHTGPRPVKMRVLSAVYRDGLIASNGGSGGNLSRYLLIHCHGGGYVATSSKSHETYLRVWAKKLNCTIVSIEYSLAPENPFPRPTEEVLYAYAWIVKNPHAVGWTGEKIAMVGDSAGGNLIMSVNLRLIQLNVAKMPDGLVPIYTPFLFQYLPSPSRLLSVMDPLLHMGVVLRCVAAYTGGYSDPPADSSQADPPSDSKSHKSLQEYVEQVQKTQRIDFAGGSQSIVSLVNLASCENITDAAESTAQKRRRNDDEPPEVVVEDDTDDDDNRSVSSVQVNADPLHIHLSSFFDSDLAEYLKNHPTTKSNVVISDENGDVLENEIPTEDSISLENLENDDRQIGDSQVSRSQPTTPNDRETKKGIPASMSTTFAPVHQPVAERATSALKSMLNIDDAHKRSLSQTLADTAVLAAGHAMDNISDWLDRPLLRNEKQKLERAASTRSAKRENGTIIDEEPATVEKESHVMELLSKGTVPRDMLISPMYAPDSMLQQLPPCYFLACHLDPLLDDTIMFAKKLRDCGGKVASLDLLPSVPHGFLNFTLMSPECRNGAKQCLLRVRQALGILRDA